jgi:ferritin-like metal-binding protein YciE
LEQTKGHVERLKQILKSLGEKATAKKCPGMAGIVEEGDEMTDEDFEGAVMDAALISTAQRAEHYEIAAYGCVHAWAQVLGEDSASNLLEKTLEEEKETDEKLTQLSETISAQANLREESEGDEFGSSDEEPKVVSKARSRTAGA